MDRKTKSAIANYSQAGCIRAYQLNTLCGEGAHSIALTGNIPNVCTTRAADAAINAGRAIIAAADAEKAKLNPGATIAAVNAALNKLGIAERLVRGRGYHYFRLGDAHTWPSSSVYVNDVATFTVAEWIEEHKQLQAAAAAR